jgi:Kef-type K+ transport system membrane component KefB
MGLLLRNVERRDNVFQAQLKTAQDIGYVLLFLMSAALVDLQGLAQGWTLLGALAVFAVRIGATRLALWPGSAWDRNKKHAMALSMCSLVSYGGLVVDTTLNAYTGLDQASTELMGALLALDLGVTTPRMLATLLLSRRTRDYLGYLDQLQARLQRRLDA